MKKITDSILLQSDAIIDLAFLPTGKTWLPNPQTQGRFIESGKHLVDFLVTAINEARELICFASFIFQEGKVTRALERAMERGVKIFVLTSTVRISQEYYYERDYEKEAVANFKDLLNNKMRNKALVRCADDIHAKYLLIDPKNSNGKGFLATCNFTQNALNKNPEIVAVLKPKEILELFKVFVWHFWEATTDEQSMKTQFTKVKAVNRFQIPNLEYLLQTSSAANQRTIRAHILELLQTAQSKIVISSFGFDINHELGQVLKKKCEMGIKVIVFAPNRPKTIIGQLEKLVKAGAKIYTHDLLHAKFILVDDREGAIFTANFEKQGMDEGVEVGLKLEGKDIEGLNSIIERWQHSFSHFIQANIGLMNLPINWFLMTDKGLRMQPIEGKKVERLTLKPKNLNEVIQKWSKNDAFDKEKIKNYHFELTLDLEEVDIDFLLSEKELATNVFWGEYEIEASSKKNKASQKIKKQGIFLMEGVRFDDLLELGDYVTLPIFALKV